MASRQTTARIDGISTHIVIQHFADRVLVLVTQLGKVGTLIQTSIPSTTPFSPPPPLHPSHPNRRPLPPPPPAIQLTPLFGTAPSDHASTLHSLYAAQIATLVWTQDSPTTLDPSRPSVIVGIALKPKPTTDGAALSDAEKELFDAVMAMVQDLLSA